MKAHKRTTGGGFISYPYLFACQRKYRNHCRQGLERNGCPACHFVSSLAKATFRIPLLRARL